MTLERISKRQASSNQPRLPRLLLLALPLLALLACEPVPDRRAMAADSIAWEAREHFRGFDTDGKVFPGGQAYMVLDRVRADVNHPERSAEYWVFAYGSNEVGNGWDLADYAAWRDLTHAPDPSACVVWIKPWNTSPTMPYGSARHVHMNEARRTIDVLVAERPNSVAVDWRPVVEADRSLLAADGVHLGPEGDEALAELVQGGIAECGS